MSKKCALCDRPIIRFGGFFWVHDDGESYFGEDGHTAKPPFEVHPNALKETEYGCG